MYYSLRRNNRPLYRAMTRKAGLLVMENARRAAMESGGHACLKGNGLGLTLEIRASAGHTVTYNLVPAGQP